MSVRRKGWAYKAHSILLGKFLPVLKGLVGEGAGGAEVLFNGSGGLVHDDQSRCAFAGLYKSMRHVARDEERVAGLGANYFVSCLDLELAFAHKEPLIYVNVVVKARSDLLRPQGVEDYASAFVVFARDLHMKDSVDELEGLVVAVFARFYQDFSPEWLSNLCERCSDG